MRAATYTAYYHPVESRQKSGITAADSLRIQGGMGLKSGRNAAETPCSPDSAVFPPACMPRFCHCHLLLSPFHPFQQRILPQFHRISQLRGGIKAKRGGIVAELRQKLSLAFSAFFRALFFVFQVRLQAPIAYCERSRPHTACPAADHAGFAAYIDVGWWGRWLRGKGGRYSGKGADGVAIVWASATGMRQR